MTPLAVVKSHIFEGRDSLYSQAFGQVGALVRGLASEVVHGGYGKSIDA